MVKEIWNTVTGNYRFIKYDGSQYHRGRVASFFDRPEMKIGAAYATILAGAALMSTDDLQNILSLNFNAMAQVTKDNITEFAKNFAIGAAFTTLASQLHVPCHLPKDKAIDTHGRMPISSEMSGQIHSGRNTFGFLSLMWASGMVVDAIIDGTPSIFNTMNFAANYLAFERCHKILKNEYTICNAPSKPSKARHKLGAVSGVSNTP